MGVRQEDKIAIKAERDARGFCAPPAGGAPARAAPGTVCAGYAQGPLSADSRARQECTRVPE